MAVGVEASMNGQGPRRDPATSARRETWTQAAYETLHALDEELCDAEVADDLMAQLAIVARYLPRVVPHHRAQLCVLDGVEPGHYRMWPLAGEAPSGAGRLMKLGASAIGRCVVQKQAVCFGDAGLAEDSEMRRAAAAGMLSACIVPVLRSGRVVALWSLSHGEHDAFSMQHLDLLRLMARIVASHWPRATEAENEGAEKSVEAVASKVVTAGHEGDPRPNCRVAIDGSIHPGHTPILDQWLGQQPDQGEGGLARIWAWVAAVDPRCAYWLEVGWKELELGELPADVVVGQLPTRIEYGDRLFSLDYQVVEADGVPVYVELFIDDQTATTIRARVEMEQRELVTAVERIMHDRGGFSDFIAEGHAILRSIADNGDDPKAQLRAVHTLNGNASVFGISTLSASCQALEDAIAEGGRALVGHEYAALAQQWQELCRRLEPILSGGLDQIEIDFPEFERALAGLREALGPSAPLVERIDGWKYEAVQVRLAYFRDQAIDLAERLGKSVRVDCACAGIRHSRHHWRGFWAAFAHVVRNAIDHGLEPVDVRREVGKSTVGKLELRAEDEGEGEDRQFVLRITDDGRGIDWAKLEQNSAVEVDPEESPEAQQQRRLALLFSDGSSSRSQPSEISGRGVGMSSVLAATHNLDGECAIESRAGEGTSIVFRFPYARLFEKRRRARVA